MYFWRDLVPITKEMKIIDGISMLNFKQIGSGMLNCINKALEFLSLNIQSFRKLNPMIPCVCYTQTRRSIIV